MQCANGRRAYAARAAGKKDDHAWRFAGRGANAAENEFMKRGLAATFIFVSLLCAPAARLPAESAKELRNQRGDVEGLPPLPKE